MAAFGVILLIFLPLFGAVVVWSLPERSKAAAGPTALGIGVATFLISLALWSQLPGAMEFGGPAGLVGETNVHWLAVGSRAALDEKAGLLSGVVLSFHTGIDAISMPLVVLTGLLVPLAIWGSFTGIRRRRREYYAWMLALTGGMFGVFVARDLLLFYIFFEITLVPLYFLIGIWGGSDRRYAANKFFLYTFVGSMITFAGIMYLALRGAAIDGSQIVDFSLTRLSSLLLKNDPAQGLLPLEQSLLFLAFFAGFAIKVPFWPLHTWLPLAHTEAPTAGSVLLAGVLLKLGTYGFLRFSLPMVPAGAAYWANVMGWLAIAGIIYGALCCWVQQDVKKLVAYSSVSHLGFCMLGMFSFMPIGVSGSVLYMINHGISTGALFLMVGMIYERYHTRDLERIGGLAWQMPVMAFFFVLFVLASIGLPGLNGFVSEFMTLFGAFNSATLGPLYGSIGALGILLGAIYMLYATGKVLFGPVKEPEDTPDLSTGLTKDLTPREIGVLAPLAVAVVVLGVYPRIITNTLDTALEAQVLDRVMHPDLAGAFAARSAPAVPFGTTESEASPVEADAAGSGLDAEIPATPHDADAERTAVAGSSGLPLALGMTALPPPASVRVAAPVEEGVR